MLGLLTLLLCIPLVVDGAISHRLNRALGCMRPANSRGYFDDRVWIYKPDLGILSISPDASPGNLTYVWTDDLLSVATFDLQVFGNRATLIDSNWHTELFVSGSASVPIARYGNLSARLRPYRFSNYLIYRKVRKFLKIAALSRLNVC